jgi:hypothetical protein
MTEFKQLMKMNKAQLADIVVGAERDNEHMENYLNETLDEFNIMVDEAALVKDELLIAQETSRSYLKQVCIYSGFTEGIKNADDLNALGHHLQKGAKAIKKLKNKRGCL